MTPGMESGRVTVKNAAMGLAPRSAAASSRLQSSFSRVAQSGSTMKGR